MAEGKRRKNPKTGKLFKRGDVREDGYIFQLYRKDINKKGYFLEDWRSPRPSKGKERLNLETGKPFQSGETELRPDGVLRRFRCYRYKDVLQNGYYGEQWLTEEGYQKELKLNKIRKKRNYLKLKPATKPRRLNPKTNQQFKQGEVYKGKYFVGYRWYGDGEGVPVEIWYSKEGFRRRMIQSTVNSTKRRAKQIGVPHSIDTNYLEEIYPKDDLCPILGIKLVRGKGGVKDNSPSLDKIIPKKGYVRGNVVWISMRANLIKQDANSEEILKVGKWLREHEQELD